MDQELADTAAYAPRRADAAFALTRWQHFSAWNDYDAMAAILKVWRHIRNSTRQSMRIYSKNNSARIHPYPNKMSNDMRSIFLI